MPAITFVAGDVLTAAQMNTLAQKTYIVNADIAAAAAIAYSKLALSGSITSADIADGTITSADIADGTIVNADINTSAGITYGKLAAIPKVRLRRAASQAVTAGDTAIIWDTEDADTDGFIAVSSSTITVPAGLGGMYAISGRIVSSTAFPANSYITVTAAGVAYAFHIPSVSTQNNGAYSVCVLLNASATVSVSCYLSSGSSNFTGNLEMCRVGA